MFVDSFERTPTLEHVLGTSVELGSDNLETDADNGALDIELRTVVIDNPDDNSANDRA